MSVMQSSGKVLVAAGGTGGHVFPALAVCEVLAKKNVPVVWVGTASGLESRVVPEAGIPMHLIDVVGWRGKHLLNRLKAPFLMLAACLSVMRLVRRENIAVILGMGGFVSAAAGFAAVMLRKPLLLQEQNAVAGSTNSWLAPFAKKIFTGFPSVLRGNKRSVFTGNPIREQFLRSAEKSERVFPQPGECIRILVAGGSLGARPINELMPEAVVRLSREFGGDQQISIIHQAGKLDYKSVQDSYESICEEAANVEVKVLPFIDDMANEMSRAHLMIARAGALSVSEALLMRLPSILIPLPHAIDDHQTANAKILADAGAADLQPQAKLTAEKLAIAVVSIMNDRSRWEQMARATEELAQPKAASIVANACIEFAHV